MANGMSGLYVGRMGLMAAQTSIDVTANNLTNMHTEGYVRQQVLFNDMQYNTLAVAKKDMTTNQSVNMMQSGLGVSIGDVVHSRDLFLDKYYRSESGRQVFYNTCYSTTNEVEELLQETEGEAFQEVLADMYEAIAELSKDPGSGVNQNLVIQKATLFMERTTALYEGIQEYQLNMNEQIIETVNRINELGEQIYELNVKIHKIEAGGVETAMDLRDARDLALDELGTLANISYVEQYDGTVRVKLEGKDFIDDIGYHEMTFRTDNITKFVTPIWKELSNMAKEDYVDVFDFKVDISSDLNTDIGKLKALVMCRGAEISNYTDVLGLDAETYNNTTGLSVLQTIEAQLDQLVHGVVTTINDLFSPLDTKTITVNGVAQTVQVWNEDGALGSNMKGPGEELFSRKYHERYREVTDDTGKTWYVYNEEDTSVKYGATGELLPNDESTLYSIINLQVNPKLLANETMLPHLTKNGEVDYRLAEEIEKAWGTDCLRLTPGGILVSFNDYYDSMVGALGTNGSVFNSVATTLSTSVQSIETQRQIVFGVSSDEELANMIKYQSAYNASSRFINVVDTMIEHIIMQLGS